jgi:hypothetical protein
VLVRSVEAAEYMGQVLGGDTGSIGLYCFICVHPVDRGVRLCNLLLLMLNRMGVSAEQFGDGLGALSGVFAE